MNSPRFFLFAILFSATIIFFTCGEKDDRGNKESQYASLIDSTSYVGIDACKNCHYDKYKTYINTGMGMSFDKATKTKTSAKFEESSLIKDTHRNLNYHPYWDGNSYMLKEFRLDKNDTSYERTEQIAWIVGSGQHTNSHLVNFNNYVYQAPVTYYTQTGKWDLPPGFEGGFNTRFSRMIGLECMTCHNAYPEIVPGSENKYSFVANGIDCERCHGPGRAHVKEKLAGKTVDTRTKIDYSIVNPAKLPIALQLDVCQRCHIQGNIVLNDDKSFLDFRPGMRLSDIMNIFMPLHKDDDNSHIMASHVERMKISKCFSESLKRAEEYNKEHPTITPYKNAMTCVTCHDPHVSVKSTDQSVFNSKCKSCHYEKSEPGITANPAVKEAFCTEDVAVRLKVSDNCVKCHMPSGGTIDIPHVTTTDHWIRVPLKVQETKKIKEFATLICINNPVTSDKTKGIAFLSYFEKFSSNPAYLDSAKKYFDDQSVDSIKVNLRHLIRWAFLKQDYQKVIQYCGANNNLLSSLKSSITNEDAWTAYRIAESNLELNDLSNALVYFNKAIELAPYQLDFRNKLAGVQHDAGLIADARKNYEFIIEENPKFASAYVNYGFLLMTGYQDATNADRMYDKALALDPDNMQAFFNKAGIRIFQGRKSEAGYYLKEVLKRDKNNEKARMLLKQLGAL